MKKRRSIFIHMYPHGSCTCVLTLVQRRQCATSLLSTAWVENRVHRRYSQILLGSGLRQNNNCSNRTRRTRTARLRRDFKAPDCEQKRVLTVMVGPALQQTPRPADLISLLLLYHGSGRLWAILAAIIIQTDRYSAHRAAGRLQAGSPHWFARTRHRIRTGRGGQPRKSGSRFCFRPVDNPNGALEPGRYKTSRNSVFSPDRHSVKDRSTEAWRKTGS